MKTTKTIILFLAIGATLFTSCKKKSKEEEAPPVTPVVTPGTFSATINGTAMNFPASFYFTSSGGGLAISGTSGTTSIGFSLFTTAGSEVGSYSIGSFCMGSYNIGNSSNSGTSGTLKITAYGNNKVSGTFNFNAPGYTITNGTFTNVLKQ